MNKRMQLLACGLGLLMLGPAGCTGQEEVPAVSGNTLSVAEEIAGGVSQNVIPAEAYEYYALEYQIPEGFVRTPDSTDTLDIYSSEQVNDYSYIIYMRQENDGSTDYRKLTEADYKASLDESLSANTVIESLEQTPGDGYMHAHIVFSSTDDRGKLNLSEHIFITDKYIFEMVYAMDPVFDWKKAFADSEASLKLLNVAGK